MLVINKVNDLVICGRLHPAFVPPVATAVCKHHGEVANSANTRSGKGRPGVGVRKSHPAVGRSVNLIDIIVREAASALVHARDVDVAVSWIACDLHVADEAIRDLRLVRPSDAVVMGVALRPRESLYATRTWLGLSGFAIVYVSDWVILGKVSG